MTDGIDQSKIQALLDRARREVDDGLLPSAQIAVGYRGEIVVEEAFGDATVDTRYCIFSATKPFVASAVWTLMADGSVDPVEKVTTYFPEFGDEGKADITVEQVMLHMSGFPHAPLGPPAWNERASSRQVRIRSRREARDRHQHIAKIFRLKNARLVFVGNRIRAVF